jgi:hypothetical protein
LALIGALIETTAIKERLCAVSLPGCREPEISHADIAKSRLGLLCMGKADYEASEAFREVPFFRYSLGIELVRPAPPFASGWMWRWAALIIL